MAKITKEAALEYHEQGRPGKIEVKPTKAYRTQTALVPGLGIAEPAVVSKSYPEYWDHLRHVGAVIDSKEADRA